MQRSVISLPKKLELPKLKRVAAYARVSSGKDAMLHSLSAQVAYYIDLIQSNHDWLFAGVFADEAQTGTKDSREQFQNMLLKCRNGEIDIIITKSISRFARNTVTLLETVRELKSLGIDVYFEEQNIHTVSSDGELMLTILASYAQEESRSASENQKWRVKKNFEDGKPWHATVLGYKLIDGKYEIVPDEAQTVKYIFNRYLAGDGYDKIVRKLQEKGVRPKLSCDWNRSVVSKILSNYIYTGNLMLQTTYNENYITKRKVENTGELPIYHVQDSHEPIIDIETYKLVQAEKTRRAKNSGSTHSPRKTYPFTGLLRCEKCGKNYRRRTTATGIVWICTTFNTYGKSACASKQIPEETLNKITSEVLNCDTFNGESLHSVISYIVICDGNRLIFHFKDGTTTERIWKDRSRSESWTEEMKERARQKNIERITQNA